MMKSMMESRRRHSKGPGTGMGPEEDLHGQNSRPWRDLYDEKYDEQLEEAF
jgi:hypothetical protein